MRVLLLQLDGSIPNLALMRIAGHHQSLGDDVELRHSPTVGSVERMLGDAFDRVYASLIFERTRPVAERLQRVYPDAVIGGTGWNLALTVEDLGVTCGPDYSVYPRFQQSIGFTQRGCRLKCDFCVVPRKEGAVKATATIADIWRGDPWPREILLLDNDFFGQPDWRERIRELQDGRFKVSFNQGINARMISDEAAEAIASVDYCDDSMRVKRIYTAWDSLPDEAVLFRGLERLKAAGVKPDHVMVYMLIGYWPGETEEDWLYRQRKLRDWGARPYPMPYLRTPLSVGFQRWVVGAYDREGHTNHISWPEWKRNNCDPRRAWRVRKFEMPLFQDRA